MASQVKIAYRSIAEIMDSPFTRNVKKRDRPELEARLRDAFSCELGPEETRWAQGLVKEALEYPEDWDKLSHLKGEVFHPRLRVFPLPDGRELLLKRVLDKVDAEGVKLKRRDGLRANGKAISELGEGMDVKTMNIILTQYLESVQKNPKLQTNHILLPQPVFGMVKTGAGCVLILPIIKHEAPNYAAVNEIYRATGNPDGQHSCLQTQIASWLSITRIGPHEIVMHSHDLQ